MKLNSLENVCDICRVISSFFLRFIFWENFSLSGWIYGENEEKKKAREEIG